MAVELLLTDEQARWLRDKLRGFLDDAKWIPHPNLDDREKIAHARSIESELAESLAAKEWPDARP